MQLSINNPRFIIPSNELRNIVVAVKNTFVNDFIGQPAVLRHIIHGMLAATSTRRIIISKLEEISGKADRVVFRSVDRHNDSMQFVIGQLSGFEFVQDQ